MPRYETWLARGGVLVRPNRTSVDLRAYALGAGLGILEPSDDTVGTLPGVSRSAVAGNVTLTNADSPYTNRTVAGRVSIAANQSVQIRNVEMMDLHCETAGASCDVEDSTIRGTLPSPVYTNGGGFVGHDIVLKRVDVRNHIDGGVIRNTTATPPYNSGVKLYHCRIWKLAYWTGAVGTVHPSDTWSHNDGIQHMGGWGTEIYGCLFDANFAHQVGHWLTVSGSEVEPYNGIAIGSLGGSPALPLHRIPDRGSGNALNGRYSTDDNGDGTKSVSVTNFLIGNNVGTSRQIIMNNNWFRGGDFAINGGGFNRGSETNQLLTMTGNRFSRDQGTQNGGGDLTATITGFGSGWATYTTFSGNIYESNGNPVTVNV